VGYYYIESCDTILSLALMQNIAVACDCIETQSAAHVSNVSSQQGPAQWTATAADLAAAAITPAAAAAAVVAAAAMTPVTPVTAAAADAAAAVPADAAATVTANAASLVGYKSST